MAFTLAAIVGSTTVTLSDSNPFSIRLARGMGGAEVRRVVAQGPAQQGDTDLGYRLAPREIELVIGFRANTDAILDSYRDTLMSIFKPLSSTPVKLRVTRDDGGVRQIDVYTRGTVDIKLVSAHRPGHYHEATIRLRAADPAWYNPTQGSVSVVGTALVASQWWLAGGAIGSAQVKEFGTAPTQGQVWTYTGTPSATKPNAGYTIAFRSAQEAITDGKFAFYAGANSGSASMSWSTSGTTAYKLAATYGDGGINLGTAAMASGTNNYFITWLFPSDYLETYRGDQIISSVYGGDYNLSGTARRWRSGSANAVGSRWSSALDRYAVYVPALSNTQQEALNVFMTFPNSQTDAQTLPIAYDGDLPEFPVLAITGPVTNPSVTNITTGLTLDFGTITIGAGTTYVIDTRPGYRDVLFGTVSKRFELTDDSDLGEFRLAPSPEATGGTNVLYLNGTAMTSATTFSIAYYDRYTSF